MPVSFNNHLAGQIILYVEGRYRRKGGGGRPFSGAVVLRLSSCLEVRHNLELLGCNLGLCCSAGYLHSSLNPEASRSALWPRPSSGFVEGLRVTYGSPWSCGPVLHPGLFGTMLRRQLIAVRCAWHPWPTPSTGPSNISILPALRIHAHRACSCSTAARSGVRRIGNARTLVR
jgi:hypothetical protein